MIRLHAVIWVLPLCLLFAVGCGKKEGGETAAGPAGGAGETGPAVAGKPGPAPGPAPGPSGVPSPSGPSAAPSAPTGPTAAPTPPQPGPAGVGAPGGPGQPPAVAEAEAGKRALDFVVGLIKAGRTGGRSSSPLPGVTVKIPPVRIVAYSPSDAAVLAKQFSLRRDPVNPWAERAWDRDAQIYEDLLDQAAGRRPTGPAAREVADQALVAAVAEIPPTPGAGGKPSGAPPGAAAPGAGTLGGAPLGGPPAPGPGAGASPLGGPPPPPPPGAL